MKSPLLPFLNLFLISVCCTFIQGQSDKNIQEEDFNGDGHTDMLNAYYDGGSGFGGKFIELTDGKSGKVFKLNTYGSFGSFLRVVPLPRTLETLGYKTIIRQSLCKCELKEEPEGSLKWLMEAHIQKDKAKEGDLFQYKYPMPIPWFSTPVEYPETYLIELEQEQPFIQNYIKFTQESDLPDADTYFLIYFGHNHLPNGAAPVLADSLNGMILYRTQHGVLVQKEDHYAWVFVNDLSLTGGPAKLRWSSIEAASIVEDLILIQFGGMGARIEQQPSKIFIVDLDHQTFGLLNEEDVFSLEGQKKIHTDKAQKTFEIQTRVKIPVRALKTEMKQLKNY